MNFDQLKTAWQAGIAVPASSTTVDRLIRSVHTADRRYRRQALTRRIYGSTTMALSLGMLAFVFWLPDGVWPGMRVAIAVWSLSLLACIVGLWKVRTPRRAGSGAPMTVVLDADLHAIRREMTYFNALRWLFWLPFGVGFVFAVSWQVPHGGAPLFLVLGTAILWIWGMFHGPRSMIARLQPQADALQCMLEESRNGGDPGKTR